MGVRKGGKGGLAPKFATTMANRRPDAIQRGKNRGKKQLDISGPSPDLTDPTKNPYFDPNLSSKAIAPRRLNKALVFNQKGKYIEQANALRRQAALETMKKRIAEAARKVGIDEDMHADKAFAVSLPLYFFPGGSSRLNFLHSANNLPILNGGTKALPPPPLTPPSCPRPS